MTVSQRMKLLTLAGCAACSLSAQTPAPNVSQVLPLSMVKTINTAGSDTTVSLPNALFSVYSYRGTETAPGPLINNPQVYVPLASTLATVVSSNIALSLSIIPLESPTSGVIFKTDPATGIASAASGTLGPIFTQRAETIGKGHFYIGITHQNFHFTSLNGKSLNGLSLLYPGGDSSNIDSTQIKNVPTAPATVNLMLDVRLSQDLAFLTYGVTNRFDLSVGLPMVHAAVASTAYNAIVYSGTGDGKATGNCWCVNTLTPGLNRLYDPQLGSSSLGKTGFGDIVLRAKGTIFERNYAVLAIGGDIRFPTGDAENYLGTGTTSFKPFVALSLFTKPFSNGIVLAPHMDVGWQFSGKSDLGGQLQGKLVQATQTAPAYYTTDNTTPLTPTKRTLPDVFSWAVGTEVALGRHNTLVVDFLGNQIGWINGAQTLVSDGQPGFLPLIPGGAVAGTQMTASGLRGAVNSTGAASLTSFGQYSGAFGYKARILGNLVASFQALVRFDNNGLTARVTPLFGLGYSF